MIQMNNYTQQETIAITIGLPVYNVEMFIQRSILSVLNQSAELNIEILAIDDCGTDNSIDIIKEYQSSHPKGKEIRIIYKLQ